MEQLELIEMLLEHERNVAAGNIKCRDFVEFIDAFFAEIDTTYTKKMKHLRKLVFKSHPSRPSYTPKARFKYVYPPFGDD